MFNVFLTLFVASLFLEVLQQINFNLPNVTSVHCDRTLANICSICSFAPARDRWNFSGAEMKLLVCSYVLRQVTGCQLRHVNPPHMHATCSVPRQNRLNFLKASGKGCGNESEHFHQQQLLLLPALKVASRSGVVILLFAFLPLQDPELSSPKAFLAASPPANNAKCVLILGCNQISHLKGAFYSHPSTTSNCHCLIYIHIYMSFSLCHRGCVWKEVQTSYKLKYFFECFIV